MGAGHAEFSRDVGIRHSDHPLVIGELDLKAVVYSGHTPPQALQLAVHIDGISHLEVEPVVVVGQVHSSLGEIDLNQRFFR